MMINLRQSEMIYQKLSDIYCPNLYVFRKYKYNGSATLNGWETEIILNLTSNGKVFFIQSKP